MSEPFTSIGRAREEAIESIPAQTRRVWGLPTVIVGRPQRPHTRFQRFIDRWIS